MNNFRKWLENEAKKVTKSIDDLKEVQEKVSGVESAKLDPILNVYIARETQLRETIHRYEHYTKNKGN